jgi:hypothetical protein
MIPIDRTDAPNSPEADRGSAQARRAAQALIGWMNPDDAMRVLSKLGDSGSSQAHGHMVEAAREAVGRREEGIDQGDLVTALPAELEAHVELVKATPAGSHMFAEGWDVALVDLTRVCAYQPLVLSDQAIDRAGGVTPHDLQTIAEVALPVAGEVELPFQFDRVKQTWMVSSANSNLRIVGPVGPIVTSPGKPPVIGFEVTINQSFLQVVRYHGRYFLRDGYHRAYGFLHAGITTVPAFVRDMAEFESMVPDPRVLLPQDSYCGPRPPVLPDYTDEAVSAPVWVPAARKLVLVQAVELTPLG